MWLLFTGACLTCLLALYGPGCLLFRGLRFSWPLALACAPLASVFGYASISVLWGMLGIDCSWATVALPVALACGALLAASRLFGTRDRPPRSSSFAWRMLALYLLAGIAVCLYVYVLSLDGPESYYCRYDNQTHYNLARHFLDTSDWSALHTGSGAVADEAQTGYYPAAWHLLVALVASATGIDMPIVMNALNAMLSGVTYPLSSFVLMHALFPARRDALFFGAFTSVGFACLPWVLLLKGQLLANLLSFSLIPAAIALVIAYVHAGARPLEGAGALLGPIGGFLRRCPPQRPFHRIGVPGPLRHPSNRRRDNAIHLDWISQSAAETMGRLDPRPRFRLSCLAGHVVRPSPSAGSALQQYGQLEPLLD